MTIHRQSTLLCPQICDCGQCYLHTSFSSSCDCFCDRWGPKKFYACPKLRCAGLTMANLLFAIVLIFCTPKPRQILFHRGGEDWLVDWKWGIVLRMWKLVALDLSERLKDNYSKTWSEKVKDEIKCRTYQLFKADLGTEDYLKLNFDSSDRSFMGQFRFGILCLHYWYWSLLLHGYVCSWLFPFITYK